jgi:hypothetical protein
MMLQRGTQIIYVPAHAKNDIHHPDCESGFVTSVSGSIAFCRYWSQYSPGELRTKAGSERTPIDSLVIRDTVPQERVEIALANWCERPTLFPILL